MLVRLLKEIEGIPLNLQTSLRLVATRTGLSSITQVLVGSNPMHMSDIANIQSQ